MQRHPIVQDPRARVEQLAVPGGPLAVLREDPPGGATAAPVLLVPGYTGSKEDFRLLLAPLADAGHPVVAVDQRGQFQSPGPDDPRAYSVDVLAQDLLGVVEALHAGPVHLVGHSFGGLVARAAAVERPASFLDVVLLGSGPAALSGPRADVMAHLRPLLAAGGLAAVREAVEAAEAAGVPGVEAGSGDGDGPVLREFLRTRFLAGSAAGLLAMGDALLAEPDRTAELAAAGLPVLVLHGDADDAWLPPVQAEMAARLGAAHSVVAGAAHSPAVEQPAATAAALLAFWNGPGV